MKKPLSILPLLAAASVLSAEPQTSPEARHFTLKVLPVLTEKCFACHDEAQKVKGELIMTSREEMLKGGERFSDFLVPGSVESSKLVTAIRWADPNLEMPPKKNDRLSDKQIAAVEQWIADGAVWPGEEEQEIYKIEERSVLRNEDGWIVPGTLGQNDSWTYRRYNPEDIWAFQPLADVKVPSREVPSEIDAFVYEKQQAAGVSPAAQAPPEQLLRRLSYDLIGLPPTPGDMAEFLSEWQNNPQAAWEAQVDRLLASPHYGERWGQHWLDVARYADTGGMSNDWERSNAWRYRDYVIRSLNEDKPYDQFVREQIAGDEMAEQSRKQRGAEDGHYTDAEIDMMVATGYLRMGPWDNAMVKAPEARQIFLDDVVNSVGQTFMSTTMRCFKCHDHKFDPLSTRDYYRVYATFAGTQMAERPLPYSSKERTDGFEEGRREVQELLAFAKQENDKLVAKREAAARAWYQENGRPYVGHDERKDLPDEEKPPRMVGLDTTEQGQLKVREQDVWIWERRLERYEAMAQSVFNGADPGWPQAKKLRMPDKVKANWKPESFILNGGALEAKGDPVTPGVISTLGIPAVEGEDPYAVPESLEGRRSVFAKWLTHPDHPLTTRSIVNRVWQYHFGKGLAANSNNFGVKGAKPTHPELLDWLAKDFVSNGWSLKRLHKQIVMSQIYRQDTKHEDLDQLQMKDPNNELLAYWSPRRLTAEEIRDSMLKITGELNAQPGGLPARPEINMEVALQPRMIQFSLAPAYQPSPTPEQRNRRSIYSYRVRGMADPFLEIFNQPNPNDACEVRDSAAVSPQVFTLLNSDLMTDRSIGFALGLEKESGELDTQITQAFELALGRSPLQTELERLRNYVVEMRSYHAQTPAEPISYPSEITRSLVEEFSGKPFEYKEILPVFRDYVPDPKAADVSPETRALADLCLILFNSNEFVFVY